MSRIERIERGVAWLDQVKPDWKQRISLDRLDLGDTAKCVLGQVFKEDAVAAGEWNGWDFALYVVELLTDEEVDAFAFDLADDEDESYGDLTAAWVNYLRGSA